MVFIRIQIDTNFGVDPPAYNGEKEKAVYSNDTHTSTTAGGLSADGDGAAAVGTYIERGVNPAVVSALLCALHSSYLCPV
jgi:hypothetical protein